MCRLRCVLAPVGKMGSWPKVYSAGIPAGSSQEHFPEDRDERTDQTDSRALSRISITLEAVAPAREKRRVTHRAVRTDNPIYALRWVMDPGTGCTRDMGV